MQHKKYDIYGFRIKPKNSHSVDKKNNNRSNFSVVGLILTFVLLIFIFGAMLVSGYIAWFCYANDLPSVRMLKTILAAIFFYFYLPYFIFIRIILKTPCL